MKEKILHNRIVRIILILLGILAALYIAVILFCMIPLPTEDTAFNAMKSDPEVEVRYIDDIGTAYIPQETARAGLIFYPGARVQNEAYAPLMRAMAEKDILAVAVDVPFSLAFFGINAADGVVEQFPEIDSWYIGGHSLGVSAAGIYLSHHTDEYDGLIMLAGFVTDDISDTDLNVISIYGDRDGVLTDQLYTKYRSKLPESINELVIEGGNHAGFAYYGDQYGDNEATIPKAQQISTAVEYCAEKIDSYKTEKEKRK